MAQFRIATFNLENFDETGPGVRPSLQERVALMRPQILRLRADVAFFQEVNGQERPGRPRALLALAELLQGTNLEGAQLVSTRPQDDAVYNERNLVIATHLPVLAVEQLSNDLVARLMYRRL
ncbi:endonuclease, partial [Arthrobacter deserti]|nr:endonuclease [Arthrobacter deserti]